MLKPWAALSLAKGSLSGAAASGGGATGESLAAASLSGRPISGDPGGSDGAAAGGLGCCAEAEKLKALRKTPASKMARGDEQAIISSSLNGDRCIPRRLTMPAQAVLPTVQSPIFQASCAIGNMDSPDAPGSPGAFSSEVDTGSRQ